MAMSASVLDQDRALFKECGMDGLITKPIRAEEIEAALARALAADAGSPAGDAGSDAPR